MCDLPQRKAGSTSVLHLHLVVFTEAADSPGQLQRPPSMHLSFQRAKAAPLVPHDLLVSQFLPGYLHCQYQSLTLVQVVPCWQQ
jgi:hypothetical protein